MNLVIDVDFISNRMYLIVNGAKFSFQPTSTDFPFIDETNALVTELFVTLGCTFLN